jgi:hypothetical protein
MTVTVKPCPYCEKLMWVKEESIEWLDETTFRFPCPHCHAVVRRKLIAFGENACGPIKPS